MVLLIFVAFIAGLVTAVSPCVLPILPIVLATGADGDRRRPYLVIAGLIASFSFFTLASVQIITALHLPSATLRDLAIVVIALFGLTLLVPAVSRAFERATGRIQAFGSRLAASGTQRPDAGRLTLADSSRARIPADGLVAQSSPDGDDAPVTRPDRPRGSIAGGLITGVGLGLVWTPCAGPILGAITSLAVTAPGSLSTLALVVAYAIGAGLPLLAIAQGGRSILARFRLRSASAWAGRAFGAIVLVTAGLMAAGVDTALSADLTSALPDWTTTLQTLERANPVQSALAQLQGRSQVAGDTSAPGAGSDLTNAGPAPELTGIDHWLNSKPLTLASLRGKVVLVDFWTYSCINCIRTLPYVESWYQKYSPDGFVVIGVHTPEFAFEHDTANVAAAIARFGITYPVAQDNEYKTWTAFSNEYWPADYLIDASGNIRVEHFGEGGYNQMETDIRTLIADAGRKSLPAAGGLAPAVPISSSQTPETYLGTDRAANYAGSYPGSGSHSLSFAAPLPDDNWSLNGTFDFQSQYITATKAGDQLELSFYARDVYLVMSSATPVAAHVSVSEAGLPTGTSVATEDVSATGALTISTPRLYHLVHLPNAQHAVVTITFDQPGAQAFAFTFGS
jgi:cytochrome c biogenesis protein CcdA/thiol-disulfide isomerase/thioredoxin